MICFDIETLGVRSSAVVLSIGCVMFSFDDPEHFKGKSMNEIYDMYISTGFFVKFKASEQFDLKRTSDKDCLLWWQKQGQCQRDRSLKIYPDDLSVEKGLDLLHKFCLAENNGKPTMWQRGSLDNVVYEDLCRSIGQEPKINYHQWMDVRTAIALTKDSASSGYCEVPNFDTSKVIKHDPVHDCAYDIMMLLFGE